MMTPSLRYHPIPPTMQLATREAAACRAASAAIEADRYRNCPERISATIDPRREPPLESEEWARFHRLSTTRLDSNVWWNHGGPQNEDEHRLGLTDEGRRDIRRQLLREGPSTAASVPPRHGLAPLRAVGPPPFPLSSPAPGNTLITRRTLEDALLPQLLGRTHQRTSLPTSRSASMVIKRRNHDALRLQAARTGTVPGRKPACRLP